MTNIIYHVYDGGELIAGFVSLATTVDFVENWCANSDVPVDIVDANTAEVIDTWMNGKWENWD